jgi:hypothetical protein
MTNDQFRIELDSILKKAHYKKKERKSIIDGALSMFSGNSVELETILYFSDAVFSRRNLPENNLSYDKNK